MFAYIQVLLLMGNYMNAGSRNEQSYGFELNYLSKVSFQSCKLCPSPFYSVHSSSFSTVPSFPLPPSLTNHDS